MAQQATNIVELVQTIEHQVDALKATLDKIKRTTEYKLEEEKAPKRQKVEKPDVILLSWYDDDVCPEFSMALIPLDKIEKELRLRITHGGADCWCGECRDPAAHIGYAADDLHARLSSLVSEEYMVDDKCKRFAEVNVVEIATIAESGY
jgi:hypothetical protein